MTEYVSPYLYIIINPKATSIAMLTSRWTFAYSKYDVHWL